MSLPSVQNLPIPTLSPSPLTYPFLFPIVSETCKPLTSFPSLYYPYSLTIAPHLPKLSSSHLLFSRNPPHHSSAKPISSIPKSADSAAHPLKSSSEQSLVNKLRQNRRLI
ncbi:hypothetical protein HAX54_015337 [Datura stramonium]|uniref:Uncharacterized protein n=1 Tax=Datura stramonium TaxID=4076 RepID=A0ABS8TS00_DATST|nr:hypothetical protein [Datura stramonium]